MKRYLAFKYNKYYPEGGMDDFVDSYDNVEAAIQGVKVASDLNREYVDPCQLGHVYDSVLRSIIWRLEDEYNF